MAAVYEEQADVVWAQKPEETIDYLSLGRYAQIKARCAAVRFMRVRLNAGLGSKAGTAGLDPDEARGYIRDCSQAYHKARRFNRTHELHADEIALAYLADDDQSFPLELGLVSKVYDSCFSNSTRQAGIRLSLLMEKIKLLKYLPSTYSESMAAARALSESYLSEVIQSTSVPSVEPPVSAYPRLARRLSCPQGLAAESREFPAWADFSELDRMAGDAAETLRPLIGESPYFAAEFLAISCVYNALLGGPDARKLAELHRAYSAINRLDRWKAVGAALDTLPDSIASFKKEFEYLLLP
jgi:hypothetical protein